MAKPTYKPGEKGGESGQYKTVGPRRGERGPYETTHTKGTPFPPTKQPGEEYVQVDPTKHKK